MLGSAERDKEGTEVKMFHLHKRLLLGLAPIVAVAALAVAPAMAQAFTVRDSTTGNPCPAISGTAGSGMNATGGCAFTAISPSSTLTAPIGTVNCAVTITGVIASDGTSFVNNVMATPGDAECSALGFDDLPWADSLAGPLPDGNYTETVDVGSIDAGGTILCSGDVSGEITPGGDPPPPDPILTFDAAPIGTSGCTLDGSYDVSGIFITNP